MLKAFGSPRVRPTSQSSSARSCSLFSGDRLALVTSFKSCYSERTVRLPGFARELSKFLRVFESETVLQHDMLLCCPDATHVQREPGVVMVLSLPPNRSPVLGSNFPKILQSFCH